MKNIPKFTYESEDDVLNIWFSKKPIDYAEQTGDVIMHFTEDGEAVYMEILDASDFLKKAVVQLPKKFKDELLNFPQTAISHQIE